MFGSKVNSEGKDINADGRTPVLVGERVMDNVLQDFKFNDDKTKLILEFKQTNGAIFSPSFMSPREGNSKDLDNLKRNMLHICTKIVSEDEFWATVANTTSFEEYINAIMNKILVKAKGKQFNLKIIHYNNYASFPFPNFIEKGDTVESTFNTGKNDVYVRTATTDAASASSAAAPATTNIF